MKTMNKCKIAKRRGMRLLLVKGLKGQQLSEWEFNAITSDEVTEAMDEPLAELMESIHAALEQTHAQTLQELGENRFAALKAVLRAARHFDDETKNAVTQTLRLLMRSVQKELPTLRRKNN